MRIFVINPGSTSTRLAVYEDGEPLAAREFQHDKAELAALGSIMDQRDYRLAAIHEIISKSKIDYSTIDGVAGRGGLLRPLVGGVYAISDAMLDDLRSSRYGDHPCNLGAVLANDMAGEWGVPAFIVDPVVTDELEEVARMTGLPSIRRRSLFHALSQRGSARTVARRRGVRYEDSNFIVCHMGGGISIGAHRQGRVVEVVNALDGEGPFSPERTGGLPLLPVLDMIERGEATPQELRTTILRQGGMYAHLGTNDLRDVVRQCEEGDLLAERVFQALAYTIARYMASAAPALVDDTGEAKLTALVLTGGMARSPELVAEITRRVGFLGPVEVVTEDEEMGALAAGAERVLRGEETAREYVAAVTD